MTKLGRPRRENPNIPAHINTTNLPEGLIYDNERLRWRFAYFDSLGKRHFKQVGSKTSTLEQLLQQIETLSLVKPNTFNWLADEYYKERRFTQDIKTGTQKNYKDYHRLLSSVTVENKSVCDLLLRDWTSGLCQKINGYLAEHHGSSYANHVHSFVHLMFTYAKNNDHVTENPATGIYKSKIIKNRDKWISDDVYYRVLKEALHQGKRQARTENSSPYYIYLAMEFSYLCALRTIEVRFLTDDNILENGLTCERRKGSNTNIFLYNDRLRLVLDLALKYRNDLWQQKRIPTPVNLSDRPILINESGQRLTQEGFKSSWQRFIVSCIKNKTISSQERFPFHELKHKSISDRKGSAKEKMKASGHKSKDMIKHYDHSQEVATPVTNISLSSLNIG